MISCVKPEGTHHCGMVDSQTGEVSHEGLPENESAYNIVRRYKIEKPDQIA